MAVATSLSVGALAQTSEGAQDSADGQETTTSGETTVGEDTTVGEQTTSSSGGVADTTDNNGGAGGTPGAKQGEGDGNGGGGGGGTAKGDGRPRGLIPLAVSDAFGTIGRDRLPDTGGRWVVSLLVGAVLMGGGWISWCAASLSGADSRSAERKREVAA